MIEKHGVHRLTYIVVAAEREREVAYASAYVRSGQILLYPFRGSYEVHGIIVMLFHAGGDGEHVGVEDDVQRIHAHLLRQQAVGASGYLDASLVRRGLSLLVEAHHHYSCAVSHHVAGMREKHFLAFLQRNGVDDTLSLHTLQSGCYHVPLRRVYHHRHLGDVRLRGYDIEEGAHLLTGIQQSVVHVYVYDQRSVRHLLSGDGHSLLIILLLDEAKELARACHITSLAHVHEAHVGRDVQQLQSAQPHRPWLLLRLVRCLAFGYLGILGYELLRRAATSAYDVHQPFVDVFPYLRSHRLGRFVIAAQAVGQSGVGIGTYIIRCMMCQLLYERLHLVSTERAVQTYRENRITAHAGKHGVKRLSAQRASGKVAHRDAEHYRQVASRAALHLHRGVYRSLRVQRVKHGLNEHSVRPTLFQSLNLLQIVLVESGVVQLTCGRVAHVRAHRACLVRRSHRSCHEARLLLRRVSVCRLSCDACSFQRHLACRRLQPVVSLAHTLRAERIGGDDVGARHQIFRMDVLYHVRSGKVQHVVVALHHSLRVAIAITPEVVLLQSVLLYHGAHRTVQYDYPVLDDLS